jgi:putative peptide modification system cyclase
MSANSIELKAPPPASMPAPLLRTLAVCDLVDSTALTEKLGDREAAEFIHRLDRLTRDLLYRHTGREIDKTDGFLVMFERPIQAVAFALDYQRLLCDVAQQRNVPLQARIGIHVGDVVLWENSIDDISRGAKAIEVEGLVKPVAARLMSLALPGQILLSGIAYTFALRAQGELGSDRPPPEWRAHGRYQFKGVAEPMTVVEVGEKGIAPLHRPSYTGKAHREVPWWRRPGMLALELALLLAVIAIPIYVSMRSPAAIAFANRDWVVIGDLNNLTDQATFNDSVQSAFRIGLEQSRYVNVLSDLKVRDTLALMQRDANKTRVDRTVGSEVAIREGARALILPTLAEIGGRVRFTVEVIDPHTQATVYTESADGAGADSVLPSLDQVNQKLRLRLGEALEVVSKESKPLDRVATRNLDALRAYSLALDTYEKHNFVESLNLVQTALKLDPDFALARVHLARLFLTTEDRRDEAVKELDRTLATRERLSARDDLYVEAWRDSLGGAPRQALEKWQLLVRLYPDFFTGESLFAFYNFRLANRTDNEVVAAAELSTSARNPHTNASNFLLGNLYLNNGQFDKAISKYSAVERGSSVNLFASALPYAARRDFERADASLVRDNFANVVAANMERYVLRAAIAYDRGQPEEALKVLAEAKQIAVKDAEDYGVVFLGAELSLRALTEPSASLQTSLSNFIKAADRALATASQYDKPDAKFQVLFAAYLAARLGDTAKARELVTTVGPDSTNASWPMLHKMQVVANGEIAVKEGKSDDAIALLKPEIGGSELYLTHVVLMDAFTTTQNSVAARDEGQWLASHRGRAYAEPNVRNLLTPLNVALSNVGQNAEQQRAQ